MKIELEGKVHNLEKPVLVSQVLDHFSLSREAYLVVVNGKLVTEDHRLAKDDEIRLVKVISGG